MRGVEDRVKPRARARLELTVQCEIQSHDGHL